ncbi:MAG: HEAT repeat domain-containing protein [Verrucomicrobia bacterium]|nr:HEAT repeat domain-containing protein [Verrucomicrobiota bacterium]
MIRHRWILVLAAVMGAAVAYALIPPEEPEFDGKRLSAWLEAFDYESEETVNVATPALRAMGSNAVIPLIRMLKAKDSRLRTKWMDLVQRQTLIQFQFTPADVLRRRAIIACEKLGPAAKAAVPALFDLVSEGDPRTSRSALNALVEIGDGTLNPFTQALTNRNERIRVAAARALGVLGKEADAAVPALLQSARTDQLELRREAEKALRLTTGAANPTPDAK